MLLDNEDETLEMPPCKRSKLFGSDTKIEAIVSQETVLPVPLLRVLTASVKDKKYTSLLGWVLVYSVWY